jgi:hypothetical protein
VSERVARTGFRVRERKTNHHPVLKRLLPMETSPQASFDARVWYP